MNVRKNNNFSVFSDTRFIAMTGVFAAAAFILQFIGSMIGIKIAGFLDVEFSDLPALIISMAYGPLSGVMCELIKNLLHLTITSTGGIGELANFIVNGVFCLCAGIIYKYNKTFKTAVLSFGVATILMAVTGIFANLFILLPLYMKGVDMGVKLSLVLKVILPFNLIKGIIISGITLLLYKRISRIIKFKK